MLYTLVACVLILDIIGGGGGGELKEQNIWQ